MRSWSISAGRIFGVELRIHWTFFLLPLFVWGTEYASHGAADGGRDVALVGIIFACVIAHELGHTVVARHAGIVAKSIILFPIGGGAPNGYALALFPTPPRHREICSA